MSLAATLRTWGAMVKLSHSVFALPFALSGAVLAAGVHGFDAVSIVWIVIAMFGARNAAMGFNRLADQDIDARNPRTAGRELPSGRLQRGPVWVVTLMLAGLFVFASFMLQPICGWLAPLALAIVFGYSYTKRFTWLSHVFLGLALGLAPVGGWLAIAGSFALPPFLLGLAVLLWVAGFDVIYACQDADFDRGAGLHSIPAHFGIRPALAAARVFHAGALAALAGVGVTGSLSAVYWIGLPVIAGLLAWEHRLVRADDLSRIGIAFFNMNGIIAAVYLAVVIFAVIWSPA